MIYGKTMDDVYYVLLDQIHAFGKTVGNTKEIRNVSFVLMDPEQCLASCRNLSLEYLLGEHLWYLAGDNSVEFISKFSSMWARLSDDGQTNNSAYGYLIQKKHGFDQLALVIDILKHDPNSRRAVINLNYPRPNRETTHDEPCTLALQFYIRQNGLECTAMMRSSDIWLGIPYDVPYFTTLQKIVAHALGIQIGPYHHFSVSMHLYTRDIEKSLSINSGGPRTRFNALKLVEDAPKLYEYAKANLSADPKVLRQDLLIKAFQRGIFKEENT